MPPCFPTQARAQIGSDRYSSIVVDAATGNVLEAANPDAPRHPASLAKLMTLYLAFEALRDRRITIEQSWCRSRPTPPRCSPPSSASCPARG